MEQDESTRMIAKFLEAQPTRAVKRILQHAKKGEMVYLNQRTCFLGLSARPLIAGNLWVRFNSWGYWRKHGATSVDHAFLCLGNPYALATTPSGQDAIRNKNMVALAAAELQRRARL